IINPSNSLLLQALSSSFFKLPKSRKADKLNLSTSTILVSLKPLRVDISELPFSSSMYKYLGLLIFFLIFRNFNSYRGIVGLRRASYKYISSVEFNNVFYNFQP